MFSSTTGHLTTSDGVRLAYRDHLPFVSGRGTGGTLLLMHGLAGHMGEWDGLLPLLLAEGHRVVMYDARGHGDSTRRPADMSRAACVRDAVTVLRGLGLAGGSRTPPTLVGQSLGGHTAFLTAAAHPELLRSLILIEAGPGTPDPGLPATIATWLDTWPTPFDRATMLAAIAELTTTSYWPDWARVTCPTLVVRGANGTMPAADAEAMPSRRGPLGAGAVTHLAVVEGAGHDVHLDQPASLAAEMRAFLDDRASPTS